ncbi:MAG: hypothetical protein KBB88_01355 [Candidatus Pacebacteria bacterium]|nr:hypothetical protein [Candidatus Paceibacterota bacterium]
MNPEKQSQQKPILSQILKERIDSFRSAFTEQMIVDEWIKNEKKSVALSDADRKNPMFEVFAKDLDDVWRYKVGATKNDLNSMHSKENPTTMLAFSLVKQNNEFERHAELHFHRNEFLVNDKQYFQLSHRLVTTKQEGISGTTFLSKAEEYIQFAHKNGLVDVKDIYLEVRQRKVINFFLKCGYEFFSEADEITYTELKNERSHFMEILVDHGDGSPLEHKDAHVLRREIIDNPLFKKHLIKDHHYGHVLSIYLADFLDKFASYIPTVRLTKDLAQKHHSKT